MSKGKILWVTDSPYSATGYGNVGRNALGRLQKEGWEVHAICTDHAGQRLDGFKLDGKWYDIPLYPRIEDGHGSDALVYYAQRIKPDIVVTLRDAGIQSGYVGPIQALKQKINPNLKWVAYVPIDTHVPSKDWNVTFDQFDHLVAMSEHGEKIIRDKVGYKGPITMIPHGVDLDTFKPLPEEEKQKLRAERNLDTMFVAGGCGRNQLRKMWNFAIRGFSLFAKNKMDVKYFFHSDIHATYMSDGWSWKHIAWKYGLIEFDQSRSQVLKEQVTPHIQDLSIAKRRDIDDSQLNKFYNMLDVYYFLTGGEGFGIPTLEAQAAGVPVIITDNTTGPELINHGKNGILVPELKTEFGEPMRWEGQNGVEFSIPNWKKAAEALERMYDDEKFRKQCSKNAIAHAKKYDWNIVAKQWVDLFNKV